MLAGKVETYGTNARSVLHYNLSKDDKNIANNH